MAPSAAALKGAPGTYVTCTVRVTNTGSASDIITLTVTGQAWPTNIVTAPGTVVVPTTTVLIRLNPGEGRNVQVRVFIPYNVAGGAQGVTLFRARSQSEPAVTATATLTTTASYKLYLPEIHNLGSGTVSLP